MLMTTSQLEKFFSNLDTDLTPSFALRQFSRDEVADLSNELLEPLKGKISHALSLSNDRYKDMLFLEEEREAITEVLRDKFPTLVDRLETTLSGDLLPFIETLIAYDTQKIEQSFRSIFTDNPFADYRPPFIQEENNHESEEPTVGILAETEKNAEQIEREAKAKDMVVKAIKTGGDYFLTFVSYLLDTKYRHEESIRESENFIKQLEIPHQHRKFLYGFTSMLENLAKELRKSFGSGLLLHHFSEALPVQLEQYVGQLILEKSTGNLYYVRAETDGAIHLVSLYQGISPDALNAIATNVNFDANPNPSYFFNETLLQQIWPEFRLPDFSMNLSHDAYQALILRRLALIQKECKQTFLSDMGKLFPTKSHPELLRYAQLLQEWLAFYFPQTPEALSLSFWAYQTRDTLPERLRILDERAKKAHTIMESYASEISLLTQSKEADMLEAPRQESERLLATLLASEKDGMSFSAIPRETREYLEDELRKRLNLSAHEEITPEQRAEGYKIGLRKLSSCVPCDAIDSEEMQNTLALLALQYKNDEIFRFIYNAPTCAFERRNCYRISAKDHYIREEHRLADASTADQEIDLSLPEKLIVLESFLRRYLENWSIDDSKIKNRQQLANSGKVLKRNIEWFYQLLDSLLGTRVQFLTREAQVKACLAIIEENRFDFDGNRYREHFEKILKSVPPGIFGQIGNRLGIGARTYRQLSNTMRSIKDLPLVIPQYDTPNQHQTGLTVMKTDLAKATTNFEAYKAETTEKLVKSEAELTETKQGFEAYKAETTEKLVKSEAELTETRAELTETKEKLGSMEARLLMLESLLLRQTVSISTESASAAPSMGVVPQENVLSTSTLGSHGSTLFGGRSRAGSEAGLDGALAPLSESTEEASLHGYQG